MQDVRDSLRALINKKGYIRRVIAQNSDLTENQLSAILLKNRKLDSNELFRLCKALDVTPDELYEARGESTEKAG